MIVSIVSLATLDGLFWYVRVASFKGPFPFELNSLNLLYCSIAIGGFFGVTLFTGWICNEIRTMHSWIAKVISIWGAVQFFGMLIGAYMLLVFQTLPQVIGGGRPEHVDIWIAREEMPALVQERFPPHTCSVEENLVHCRKVPTLSIGDDYLAILMDTPPAILVTHDGIKALTVD